MDSLRSRSLGLRLIYDGDIALVCDGGSSGNVDPNVRLKWVDLVELKNSVRVGGTCRVEPAWRCAKR